MPPRTQFSTLIVVLGLLVSSLVPARAQQLVGDFSAGQPSGDYAFASSTPKTFGDLIKGNMQEGPVNVTGHLYLPAAAEKEGAKVPAIVFIHGSGGVYSAMLDFWPKLFNSAGYAMLAVDSFGPRGVKSTADDQSQVPFAADTADAFAALKLMATHPRIDPTRIAILGTSRGGITAWRTAVERVIAAQKLPDGLRFAAHIPYYSGGCVGLFRLMVKPGLFDKTPMQWVHGNADDYALMAPCQDYADRIGKAGTPVEFVVIDGARHKFDSDDQKLYTLRGAQRTLEGCPIEIDADTQYAYDRFTGQRLSGEAFQNVLKTSCSALGASVEGNRAQRDKAAQATLAFLRKTFGR